MIDCVQLLCSAFKARVDQCRDIKRHYDAITESLTSRTDFIEKLEDSYAADTDTVSGGT